MNIELTLMNRSVAGEDVTVVFFQKNRFTDNSGDNRVIAWRVCSLPAGASKKIHISAHLSVSAVDASGNQSQQHLAEYGQSWHVSAVRSRDWMVLDSEPAPGDRLTIRNTQSGTVTAQISKDGRLLAVEQIAAKRTVTFGFESSVWFGVTSLPVAEGDRLPQELGNDFGQQLQLGGHSRACLVFDGKNATLDFPVVEKEQAVRV